MTRLPSLYTQPCLTSTSCLHPSSTGANGGRVSPGMASTHFLWTILPTGVTMAGNSHGRRRRCTPLTVENVHDRPWPASGSQYRDPCLPEAVDDLVADLPR